VNHAALLLIAWSYRLHIPKLLIYVVVSKTLLFA
jgi:hypothetical protein